MKVPLRALVSLSLGLSCLAACGRDARPTTPSRPAAVDAVPRSLVPNVERDRRADVGVRAPAKTLASTGRMPRCGKKLSAAVEGGRRGREPAAVVPGGRPARPGGGRPKRAAASAPAGNRPPAAEPIDLLAGRLRIGPLEASRSLPPAPGGPLLEEEWRLVVDASGEGLAIVAKETFQLDPDRYAPDADADPVPGTLDEEAPKFLRASFPDAGELDVFPVELGDDKLRAYVARPKEANAAPGKDTALVLAMLVAHPDGTLQSVTFHVRGEMVRVATGSALAGCTRLAERVASTLTAGPRSLDRAAGERRVLPVSSDRELAVRVPPDYVTVRGDDVARIYKLRPLSLYAGNIAIVVGPKRDGRPQDLEAGASTVAGRLLGHDVQWQTKALPKGGGWLYASELLDDGAEPRFAEVLVKASRQAKVLEEMQRAAETLVVVPKL